MKYQIKELIGRGKFGTVYRGINPKNGEIVAIKKEPESIILKHEAQILNYLYRHNCSNIPWIYWFGLTKSSVEPTLVMCWMNEGSLATVYRQIDRTILLSYWKTLVKALYSIHMVSIIHRDIKPENCMLRNGDVFLIDFGLSHLIPSEDIHSETILGTPSYISTYIHEGHSPTRRDDLISLGYTFLYLLGYYQPVNSGINNNSISIHDQRNQNIYRQKMLWREQDVNENSYMKICYSLGFSDIPDYELLLLELNRLG